MTTLTIDSLRELLQECAGEDETIWIDDAVLDVSFGQLGYDSLALMETAARIKQEYGLSLPDELIVDAATPRDLLLVATLDIAEVV